MAALLALPKFIGPPQLGQAIGAVVLLYHVVLIAGAWLRSQHELVEAWMFLLPLSFCQVIPDWLLVREFGVLVFPDLGAMRVGPVPIYMAGLWVPPLLVVLWLAEMVHARFGPWLAALVAALSSLAVFGAAEWAARGQSLWLARNVDTFQGVALYILAAEALLGVATWLAFVNVQGRALPLKVIAAAAVSMFYAGAAAFSLLVFQRFA